jgi:hypothetical protein
MTERGQCSLPKSARSLLVQLQVMAAADLVVIYSQSIFTAAHDTVCLYTQAAVHMQLCDASLCHLKNQLRLMCEGTPLDLLGYHIPQGAQAWVKEEDEGRAMVQIVLHLRELHTQLTQY